MSIVPSLLILGLVTFVALLIALKNPQRQKNSRLSRAAAKILLLATLVQTLHFTEEAFTGFAEKFPALFGLPAMPLPVFTGFNLIWISIWLAAIPGLHRAKPWALFAAWFLALAGLINGIAHPLLSIITGGYFPGLITSPFIGAVGVWLGLSLRRAAD